MLPLQCLSISGAHISRLPASLLARVSLDCFFLSRACIVEDLLLPFVYKVALISRDGGHHLILLLADVVGVGVRRLEGRGIALPPAGIGCHLSLGDGHASGGVELPWVLEGANDEEEGEG